MYFLIYWLSAFVVSTTGQDFLRKLYVIKYEFLNCEYYPVCTVLYICICIKQKTVKLKLATQAKPTSAIPMGRTVKASTNIQLVRIGLVISVDCEHGDRIDRLVPAPEIHSVL
jgi:hypothetical protein